MSTKKKKKNHKPVVRGPQQKLPGVEGKLERGRKRTTDTGAVTRALASLKSRGVSDGDARAYLMGTGARRYLALRSFRGQK
jgi:hypothetical protein